MGVFWNFLNILRSQWKAVSSKKRIVAQKSRIVAQKTRIVAVKGRWPAGRRWLPILRSMRLRVAVVVSCWTMRKEVAEIQFLTNWCPKSKIQVTLMLKSLLCRLWNEIVSGKVIELCLAKLQKWPLVYYLSLLEKMRLSLFFKAAQSYQKGARLCSSNGVERGSALLLWARCVSLCLAVVQ